MIRISGLAAGFSPRFVLPMIVKLHARSAGPTDHPDLTPGELYPVIGIEAGDLRLLNDQGRPYLYPADLFEVVDAREPGEWVRERGEDDERYAYPPPLSRIGFFEDFFDGEPSTVMAFWRTINHHLAAVG